MAAGAGQSYFGNDQFAEFAPGMKSIDDALELRGRIFGAFELAELATDPAEIDRLLTFVVVGAGPTGVEMAGQIAELARRTLHARLPQHRPQPAPGSSCWTPRRRSSRPSARSSSARRAKRAERASASRSSSAPWSPTSTRRGIEVKDTDGTQRRIHAVTKIWAAGVQASPLGKQLAEQSGAELDRAGRIAVQPDLTLPGHPEVYVVGDMIALDRLPGVAQVAIQGGRYAAEAIKAGSPASRREPFHYHDKGSMATVAGSTRSPARQAAAHRLHRLADVAGRAPVLPGRLQEPGHHGCCTGP